MPVFSSRGFQRGNVRPTARVWTTKSFARLTALPDSGTVDKGVIAVSLQANVPNQQAGLTLATPLVQYGTLETATGTKAFEWPNLMLTSPYKNYSKAVVLATKIKVYAIPFGGPASDPDQGLATDSVYCPEAQVSLSMGKNREPFGSSSDAISLAAADGQIPRAYNTAIGYTRQNVGARAVGCTLEATYTPNELFQLKDVTDNLFDHSFFTNGNIETAQDPPLEDAFFTIVIGPTAAGCPNAAGTGIVHGRVMPHRVSIQFEHKVLFYIEDPSGTVNVPIAQAGAAGGESAFPSASRVFEAADAVMDGIAAGAEIGARLAKRRRGRDMLDL